MTISNTYVYNDFRDEVIKDALLLVGAASNEEVIQASDLQVAARFLNRLLKYWATKGLHLWRRSEAYLIPQNGQYKYTMGSGNDVAVSSYVNTTLTTNQLLNDTVLNITSNAGFVNGNKILIQLSNNNLQSTTIISSTATTVTITAGLTATANEGAVIYVYDVANIIPRPLKLLSMRRRTSGVDLIDVPMTELTYDSYFNLPFKNGDSSFPTQWMCQSNRDTADVYLWQAPDDVTVIFPFTYEITLADVTSANQTCDCPEEWLMALVYQLACSIAIIYGKSALLPMLKPIADEYFNECLNWDAECVSVAIEPSNWQQIQH
jgi:hypothetical protein